MMRALFAAISGLRNHQLFMDTVGNNLANVNTTGFKASRMTFSDLLSQTLGAGSAPTATLGGINSKQVGLGSQIASIDILQLQGSMQSTGKATDLAIQGDGFFILSNGLKQSYTRDGAFDIASDGSLVNPSTGMKVQGWSADATGAVNTTGAVGNLNIPIGQQTVASETDNAAMIGNLDSRATSSATAFSTLASAGLTIVDSLGAPHNITITFANTGNPGEWRYEATGSATDTTITTPGIPSTTSGAGTSGDVSFAATTGLVHFDANGRIDLINGAAANTDGKFTDLLSISFNTTTGATDLIGGAAPGGNSVVLDFTSLTGLAATSEVAMSSQDGFTSGTLVAFRLGATGEIVGIYTNGLTQNLGRLALANFVNPGGLTRAGGNLFDESGSSGTPLIGVPGNGGRGIATSGNLESSNVDLSREFTNMIIGQRGFQANARVVTTADEMLNDLVNLRR